MSNLTRNMEVLGLYRSFMKVSRQFKDYNFRHFFIRKAREDFKLGTLTLEEAKSELEVLKRQVIIQNLYNPAKSVLDQD